MVHQKLNHIHISQARAEIGDETFEAVFEQGRSMPLREALRLARERDLG